VVTVADTSVVYAMVDKDDANHEAAVGWYHRAEPDLVTTLLVLAEADHLIGKRLGDRVQARWWTELTIGAYVVDWWPSAVKQVAEIAQRWAGVQLGLTDASLIALADRYETLDIATFDDRHFRAVRSLDDGRPFRLLPTDL
jgi:predicted nucleic acid-binding protein